MNESRWLHVYAFILKLILASLISILLLDAQCFSAVKSSTGNLIFGVGNNDEKLMVLNSTGLGIGTLQPSANLDIRGQALVQSMNVGGMSNASSNLSIHGSYSSSFATLSSNSLLNEGNSHSVYLLNSASSDLSLKLPYAANVSGRVYQFKKISEDHRVNIGSSIDDKISVELTCANLGHLHVISSGLQWNILDGGGYRMRDVSDNLVLQWSFDDSETSIVYDRSDHGLHGIHHVGDLRSDLNSQSGVMARAINMTGSGLNLRNTSAGNLGAGGLDIGRQNMTLSFWIHADQTTNQMSIINNLNGLSQGYFLYSTLDLGLIFLVKDLNNVQNYHQTGAGWFELGRWVHWAITLNHASGVVQFYKDGMLIRTHTGTGYSADIVNSNHQFMLGKSWTGHLSYFKLDDFRIFNRLLSHEEVKILAHH